MRTTNSKTIGWMGVVAGLLFLAGWAMDAGATAYTWDASGSAPLDDGGGNWNPSGGANWNTGASYGAWGNALTDTATFGVGSGAASTVTVANVNCGGITFNAPGSGSYVLSGGTITFNAGGAINVQANTSPTISSDIAGNGAIALNNNSGSSWLTLNGVISGGAVTFGSGSGGGTPRWFLNNANNSFNGTVSFSRGGLFIGANAPSGSNGALGNSTGAISLWQGNWQETGVYIAGPYTVGRNINITADANTFKLSIGGSTADSSVFSGNIALNRRATVDAVSVNFIANPNGTVTFSGNVSGNDSLYLIYDAFVSCGGDIVLSGDNSGWAGSLSIALGRVIVGSNTALGTSTNPIAVGDDRANNSNRADKRVGLLTQGPVTVSRKLVVNRFTNNYGPAYFGGTTADSSSYTGDIILTNRGGYVHYFTAATNGQVTVSGNIIEGSGAAGITKIDAGTVIFAPASGTNTYSGGTTISAGMLAAGSPDALGTTGTIAVSSNGTFGVAAGATFSRAVTFNAGSGLGGSGTFNRGAAWTLPANFTLRPGMSTNVTGTLIVDTANAALTAASGTRLEVDFTADGNADKLVVAGTGSLNLGTASDTLVLKGKIRPGSYVIASAPGGITGTFNTEDLSGLSVTGVKVTYPGDGTVVVVAPISGMSIIVQ